MTIHEVSLGAAAPADLGRLLAPRSVLMSGSAYPVEFGPGVVSIPPDAPSPEGNFDVLLAGRGFDPTRVSSTRAPFVVVLPGADFDASALPPGTAVIDAESLRIELPRDGWTLDPIARDERGHVDGAIALIEASDGLSLSLDRRARHRGTGVAVSVSLARRSGFDIGSVIAWAIADERTRVIVLLLDRIEAPNRVLELADAARAHGKSLVVARSHSDEAIAEVRPGIPRSAMIEAAFGAADIPVVETIDAALALAEWTAAGGDWTDPTVSLVVRLEDRREVERLAAAERRARRGAASRVVVACADDSAGTIPVSRAEDASALVTAFARRALVSGDLTVQHDEEGELDLVLSRYESGRLDAVAAADLASAAGLPGIPFVTVKTGTEAIAAGLDIGFPIAAKAVVRLGDGTTTIGSVALDVPRLKELRKTVAGFQKTFGASFVFAVLQPQVTPVAELMLGSFHEPGWGEFLWLRAAGTIGPVVDDLTVVRAPVSRPVAQALLDRSAIRHLLVSDDGRAIGDVDALLDAIQTVGGLATMLAGRLKDFVLHPLAVLKAGTGAFALDVRSELGRPPQRPEITTTVRLPRKSDRKRSAF